MQQRTEIGKAFDDAQKKYVEPLKEALQCLEEECKRVVEEVIRPALKEVMEALQMGYGYTDDQLIGEHDQWLLGGDCKECRRVKYCTKLCTAHKKNLQRLLIEGLKKNKGREVIDEVAKEAYGE